MATVKWRVGREGMVEVSGSELKGVVAELSLFLEFFSQDKCGRCGSVDIVPAHRLSGGYQYYEFKCNACGSALKFGQTQEGGRLYPKRKLEDGSWDRDHNGWQPPYTKSEPVTTWS